MKKAESGDTKIALINNNISYIQKDISEIKGSIKELAGVYITKVQFDDSLKSFDIRLTDMKKSSNAWKVISPALSSIITAVITFLLISYIQSAK